MIVHIIATSAAAFLSAWLGCEFYEWRYERRFERTMRERDERMSESHFCTRASFHLGPCNGLPREDCTALGGTSQRRDFPAAWKGERME